MSDEKKPGGPDLTQGVLPADFAEGKLLGHVADDEVLLVRVGSEVVAIDPYCSHYHGPLADGLVVDDTIRCPWQTYL
jgi:nitrite reductase/ring-hydroxylating ferredoxin subunit